MTDPKDIFFSPENKRGLLNKFVKNTNCGNDKRTIMSCNGLLGNVAVDIWEKYKKKSTKYPTNQFITALNKKVLDTSEQIINDNKKKSKSMGMMSIDREKEVNDRRPRLMKNPQATKQQMYSHNNRDDILESDLNNGGNFGGNFAGYGYAGFDSDISGLSPYIRADGGIGQNFSNKININEYVENGKTKSQIKGNLDADYAKQMQARGLNPMMGNNNMNNGNYNNGMDHNNVRFETMGYNPNPFDHNRPRENINFCMDGGDTRSKQNDNNMQNNMQNNGNYGGLENGLDNDNNNNYGFNMGEWGNHMTKTNNIVSNDYSEGDVMGQINHRQFNNDYDNDNNDYNSEFNNNTNMKRMMQEMMESMLSTFMSGMTDNKGDSDMGNINMGDYNQKEIKKISKKNKALKTSIANDLGIDPKTLMNLSSKEIGKIIENNKKNIKEESDNESSDVESDEDDLNVKNVIKKFEKMKKQSLEEKENLNKMVKKKVGKTIYQSDSDSDNSSPPKNKNNGVTEIFESEHIDNKKTNNVKSCYIDIDCSKIEDNPDCYNDYCVKFKDHFSNIIDKNDKITGIKRIVLEDIRIQMIPKITERMNNLTISVEPQNPIEMCLDSGDYTLEEIIEGFNENYENEGCGVYIDNKDGIISLRHTDNEIFTMDCSTDNSIGKILGFEKKKYTNSAKYIGKYHHAFNDKPIYMYIINFKNSEDETPKPFAKINPDGSFEQYIKDFPGGIELKYVIFQFRLNDTIEDEDDESDLVNFGGAPHQMTFRFDKL